MSNRELAENRRVLVVDDDPQIHAIVRRVLTVPPTCANKSEAAVRFEMTSALCGEEAEAVAREAEEAGQPFALAFVDMNMPGLDGTATLSRLWHISPELQAVVCTGAADKAMGELLARFGHTDQLIILKKPFEMLEVFQLANAMTSKWQHFVRLQHHLANLEAAIFERTEDARKAVQQMRWELDERKRFEAAAHENEERLRSLFANIPGAVYRCTPPPERRIEFISELIWELSGFASAEFLEERTQTFASITHPEDFPLVQAAIQEGLARRLPYVADYRVVRGDGALRWVHEKGQAVFNAEGQVRWLDGVIFDITERKQQEEEMRRLHRETEKLFASISAVLIGVDVEGRVARWNEAAAQTFGLAAEAVMHQSFHSLPIAWDWEKLLTTISHAVHTERHLELDNFPFTREIGREAFLNLSITPSKPDVENRLNYILLAVDVTQRRALETQLRQAQKLESIGQLAAGIAHEINTPTQYIGDNLRFLQDAFRDLSALLDAHGQLLAAAKSGGLKPELIAAAEQAALTADVGYLLGEIPRAIGESLAGVERVSTIVRAMKDFSHPGTEEKTPVDLTRAIESTLTVARNEWKYVADLQTDFDTGLPPVPCLPGEFNQVVLNLVVNAAHAIAAKVEAGGAGKGVIAVRTRRDGRWADVRITDSGTGIPETARGRIFEPFFTTKEVGRGTGQGLAIARSVVVDKHGGTITFETETGRGTTFIVRLPLAPDSQEEPPA